MSSARCFHKVTSASLVVLLLACIGMVRSVQAGTEAYILSDAIWPTSTIAVCWENPDANNAHARTVVQIGIEQTWAAVSAIEFVGWGQRINGHPLKKPPKATKLVSPRFFKQEKSAPNWRRVVSKYKWTPIK